MVDWLSLAVPIAYLGVLIGSLATFSSLYRKRKAQKATLLEPWFPPHLQRDIYFSLLHLDPPPSKEKEKKAPAVPESVLKAALLRRATEDIRRILALRSQKQALAMLLQRGSVGDDLWQRFLRAEKEMEDEVRDVATEANAYVPNWGQVIFQSANEMMNNVVFRERMESHVAKLEEERQWWEKKRASAQNELMKELNMEDGKTAKTTEGSISAAPSSSSVASGVAAKTFTAATTATTSTATSTTTPATATAPPAPSVAGSDDDAVLVEADEQTENASGRPVTPGGGGGGKKKKKGKK